MSNLYLIQSETISFYENLKWEELWLRLSQTEGSFLWSYSHSNTTIDGQLHILNSTQSPRYGYVPIHLPFMVFPYFSYLSYIKIFHHFMCTCSWKPHSFHIFSFLCASSIHKCMKTYTKSNANYTNHATCIITLNCIWYTKLLIIKVYKSINSIRIWKSKPFRKIHAFIYS